MKYVVIFTAAEIPREIFIKTRSAHIMQIKIVIMMYLRDTYKYTYMKLAEVFELDHSSIVKTLENNQNITEQIPWLSMWRDHFITRYEYIKNYKKKGYYGN